MIARLRPQLAQVTGLQVFLNTGAGRARRRPAEQLDLPVHAEERQPADLRLWATRLAEAMKQQTDVLTDVDTDQQDNGVETRVEVDRDSASRLGLSVGGDRLGALQRLRPARGGDDLRRAQPVPRDHGMGIRATPRARMRSPTSTCRPRGPEHRHRRATRHGRDRCRRRGGRQRHAGHRARPTPARATPRPATRSATPSRRWCRSAPSRRFVERATPTAISHQDGELATTISFNLAEGATLDRRARGDPAGRGRHRHADQRARLVPGHGAGGAAVAGPADDADRRRDRRDLHRARHPLREPGASGHGALDPAVGRRRRGARAAAVPDGVLDHRADRRVPADRHRQEERDPDHRLRARGRAHAAASRRWRRCARPACCAFARS